MKKVALMIEKGRKELTFTFYFIILLVRGGNKMQYQYTYDEEKQDKLSNSRNYLVVKSNALIQKTRYNLSTQEQKIILYLISRIQPTDTELQYYTFDIKDLCRICGIECIGQNYQNFKESIQSLRDKSFWVETETKLLLLSWLQEVEINKQETQVRLRLDDRLKPYLLSIGDNFTKYQLENTLLLKSKYSIRLYEFFVSRAFRGYFEIGLGELKETLEITGYDDYKKKGKSAGKMILIQDEDADHYSLPYAIVL